ncbi:MULTISPECIES: GntR family transcriptional regulator [unclassified Nocardia]|uniref:GntR family transcriptional regulator n=1 Tax=unclassified Nocardia TaxID=2637762 RepID=UPI001CE46BB5|nr:MULTISPECIES: GntR family transcriptional regulator [unclassified Nocardia]
MATRGEGAALVRPLADKSLAQQVATEIRRSIVFGVLRPGQAFSVREIAAQLNVSFIPVREALRELESQGLVINRPGRSPLVAPLSAADLRGIFRLRGLIEPELGARACPLLDVAARTRLHELIDRLTAPAGAADERYDAELEFHLELIRPAATAWDIRTLDNLWHAASRYRFNGARGRGVEPRADSFRALADAADPERARAAVRVHLDALEADLRRGLDATDA